MRTVSAFVGLSVCAIFACSGKKSGDDLLSATFTTATSPTPGPAESAAAAPAPTPSGTSGAAAPPPADVDTDAGAAPPPPSTCAPFAPGARGPDLAPDACKTCAATACCAPFTTCYGGDAASGVAGADGVKTACMLAGACLDQCDGADGGPFCEAECEVTYGSQAVAVWDATQQCIVQSCAAFCP